MADGKTQVLDLEQFDSDGALRETGAALDGDTRAAFLRRAGVATASLVGAGSVMAALPSLSVAQGGVPRATSTS